MEIKLRRSQLAVPGSNPKMIEKGSESDADEAFLDLEDAVAPTEKVDVRGNVIEGLQEHDWSEVRPCYRINGADTKWWYNDVIEVVREAGEHLDTLMIPMAADAADVKIVDRLLTQVEANHGLPEGGIGLQVQIETAEGMTNIKEIAEASERLEALIFGPGDYAASVGAASLTIGAEEGYPGHYWHYQLARIVHVAKAHGLQAIDGPFSEIENIEGFRKSCQNASSLGCNGKWAIHPLQIEPANEIFAPKEDEVEKAQKMIKEYEKAQEKGLGAISFEGEMIDEAAHKMAKNTIEKARKAGML